MILDLARKIKLLTGFTMILLIWVLNCSEFQLSGVLFEQADAVVFNIRFAVTIVGEDIDLLVLLTGFGTLHTFFSCNRTSAAYKLGKTIVILSTLGKN